MRTSQPSPYGSPLIVSGSSTAFSFTSSTSPESGAIDVRDGLDRLDLGIRLILRHGRADLGRLEVDELAERVLGVPGDPEHRLLAVDPGPVVLGVVAEVVGIALVSPLGSSFR